MSIKKLICKIWKHDWDGFVVCHCGEYFCNRCEKYLEPQEFYEYGFLEKLWVDICWGVGNIKRKIKNLIYKIKSKFSKENDVPF